MVISDRISIDSRATGAVRGMFLPRFHRFR
jgi:hypothetical protein